MTIEERQKVYMELFKKFPTVKDGIDFVSDALKCQPMTAYMWRSLGRNVKQAIPERKLNILLNEMSKANVL